MRQLPRAPIQSTDIYRTWILCMPIWLSPGYCQALCWPNMMGMIWGSTFRGPTLFFFSAMCYHVSGIMLNGASPPESTTHHHSHPTRWVHHSQIHSFSMRWEGSEWQWRGSWLITTQGQGTLKTSLIRRGIRLYVRKGGRMPLLKCCFNFHNVMKFCCC